MEPGINRKSLIQNENGWSRFVATNRIDFPVGITELEPVVESDVTDLVANASAEPPLGFAAPALHLGSTNCLEVSSIDTLNRSPETTTDPPSRANGTSPGGVEANPASRHALQFSRLSSDNNGPRQTKVRGMSSDRTIDFLHTVWPELSSQARVSIVTLIEADLGRKGDR